MSIAAAARLFEEPVAEGVRALFVDCPELYDRADATSEAVGAAMMGGTSSAEQAA